MLDLSEVAVSRKSMFLHHWSRLSLHQFLFIYIIAITVNGGGVIGAPAYGAAAGCEALRTCAQCTGDATATACQWSFPDQKCFAGGEGSPAAAKTAADCPKFISVGGSDNVTTTIVSDGGGAPPRAFAQFLAKSGQVTCHVNEYDYDGVVDEDRGTIHCVRTTGDEDPTLGFCTWPTTVAYLAIAVDDGPPLVFDDARDHYVSLYPASCDRTCPRAAAASCTACQWDDGRYRHYCTWCPARDECGPYHACDRRRLADLRSVDGGDDGRAEPLRLDDRCTRGVGPFRPAGGPWTGGTVLRIDVPDRGALLWHPAGQNVTVTVAGRECAGPRWSGDTVVCTVAPAPPPYVGDAGSEPDVAGPVVLTVGGSPELIVRSAADFRFVGAPEQPDATADVGRWPSSSTADPAPSPPPHRPTTDPAPHWPTTDPAPFRATAADPDRTVSVTRSGCAVPGSRACSALCAWCVLTVTFFCNVFAPAAYQTLFVY